MSTTESTAIETAPIRHTRALAACGLTLVLGLVWGALALSHPDFSSRPFWYGGQLALWLCYALFGTFLLVNRRARGLGGVLLAVGLLQTVRWVVGLAAGIAGATGPAVDLLALLNVAGESANAFLIIAFPLWLPDGRLPRGPLGRGLVAASGLMSVVLGFGTMAGPSKAFWYGLANPLRHGLWAGWERHLVSVLGNPSAAINLGQDLFAGFIVFNLLVAAVRRRRSPGPHGQLAEIVLPYLFWAMTVTLPYYLHENKPWLGNILVWLGPGIWLLGLLAAYRRDRSLSLDRATLRLLGVYTFSAALYIAVLVAGYVVHELLPPAGRGGGAWWWTVLVALLVGAALRPAARAVIQAVDRYYYGERAHPYQVARDLAERMRHTVSPGEAPPLLCATVVGSLGLPAASVRIDGRGGQRPLAALGTAAAHGESFPLTYEGTPIGDLYVSPRAGQATLDRQDREVLQLLADQASPAIASLRLYEDLQASRKQIVLAREEERRRLRHDLHDGLGPALSGLRLQVDAARTGVPADSGAAASLSAASTGIGHAITELRRITDGLAPAALGSDGLAGALRQLTRQLNGRTLRMDLDLDPDPLPRLPAAVEVAIYRISGEALNNVIRHSGATDVRLTVRVGAQEVTVEAHDNGAGFPTASDSAGVGLRSMAERAEELGGSFSAANDLQGAIVRAVFPRSQG